MPHDHSGHGHHGHSHGTEQKTVPAVKPNVTLVTDKPNLTVSERASSEIKTIMAAEKAEGSGLRLGVEPGGCAGYQYALSFATAPEGDEVVAESNGVKVFVAKRDLPMLQGVTIDFVETAMGAGFNIKNPNAKSTCGCGNTFDA